MNGADPSVAVQDSFLNQLRLFFRSRNVIFDGVEPKPEPLQTQSTQVNQDFVSDDGYDLCVICHEKSEYKTETPIDERMDYVETVGQLCFRCGRTNDGAC